MLQDLDSLAARIGQMVQFTRQLQNERAALQAQLKGLEQERDALRDQLAGREAQYSSMHEQAGAHEAQVQALRTEAETLQAKLQFDVAQHKADGEAVRQKLEVSQANTSRLRLVADQARENIDSILMRLPGAAQE